MGPSRAKHWMAWGCVFALVVSALTPSSGLLVCLGTDGHVDLGPIVGGCCDDETPAPSPAGGDACDEAAGECCPCIDLALAGSCEIRKGDSARTTPVDGGWAFLMVAADRPVKVEDDSSGGPVSRPRTDPIPHLRSVILRT